MNMNDIRSFQIVLHLRNEMLANISALRPPSRFIIKIMTTQSNHSGIRRGGKPACV